jgi:hypothetical protein
LVLLPAAIGLTASQWSPVFGPPPLYRGLICSQQNEGIAVSLCMPQAPRRRLRTKRKAAALRKAADRRRVNRKRPSGRSGQAPGRILSAVQMAAFLYIPPEKGFYI